MTIPTHVVIPVRDRLDLTQSVLAQLWSQPGWDRLTVYDNGSAAPTQRYLASAADVDPRVEIRRYPEGGIYDLWNDGFSRAVEEHPGKLNVMVINNDIIMAPNTVAILADALRFRTFCWAVYPDYDRRLLSGTAAETDMRIATGTYRMGGLSGWCFMLAAERIVWRPLVDPSFQWWAGDDDMVKMIETRGGCCARVGGLPLDHLAEGTAKEHEWVAEAKQRDRERYLNKWHEHI